MDDAGAVLRQRWDRTLPGHGEIGAELLVRYGDPGRRYHDRTHLAGVLAAIDVLSPVDLQTVELAAWFHDAVYDVRRDDNEEQSASFAEARLSAAGLDRSQVEQVARLVRLTARHDPEDDDIDGAVLCDADLAILASDEQRYTAYVEGVREEYAHVDDNDFRAGRAAVLRRLLALPQLFNTAEGRRRWLDSARANLERELHHLVHHPSDSSD